MNDFSLWWCFFFYSCDWARALFWLSELHCDQIQMSDYTGVLGFYSVIGSSTILTPSVLFLKAQAPVLLPPVSSSQYFLPPRLSFTLLSRVVLWASTICSNTWSSSLLASQALKNVDLYITRMYTVFSSVSVEMQSWASVSDWGSHSQAYSVCSRDLPALAMLSLTDKDAVLQEGAVPAV